MRFAPGPSPIAYSSSSRRSTLAVFTRTNYPRSSMEAALVETADGLVPEGEGWYVMNAREARWFHSDEFGSACTFEGDIRFPEFGINIGVVQPGQPACLYHSETAQEDFLVLAGECLLLGTGRRSGQRDR